MRLQTTKLEPQKIPEKAIQAAVVRHLSMAGWVVVRVNSGAMKKGDYYVRGYTIAGMSVAAGFPDVTAYHRDGRFLLLEIKTEKGELTDSQKKFHEFAKGKGVTVHVVRSVEDLKAIVARQREEGEG